MNRQRIGWWMLATPFCLFIAATLGVAAWKEPLAVLGALGIFAWIVAAIYLIEGRRS